VSNRQTVKTILSDHLVNQDILLDVRLFLAVFVKIGVKDGHPFAQIVKQVTNSLSGVTLFMSMTDHNRRNEPFLRFILNRYVSDDSVVEEFNAN
jgi:hypothetical protein